MIVGLGIDLVELSRIRKAYGKFGQRFLEKWLHPDEQRQVPHPFPPDNAALVAFLASRFAVKEAGVKALGTGFTDGIGYHDVAVASLPTGAPQLVLHGKALARAAQMGVVAMHVSLTHAKETAGAVVILEK